MALADLVLGLVAAGVRYGYAIERHLAATLGGRTTVQRSHVYAALHALERSGLVAVRDEPVVRRPRRRAFGTTPRGDARLRAWLGREPWDAASLLRRTLPMKTALRAALAKPSSRREIARERALRLSHLAARAKPRVGDGRSGPGAVEALLFDRARRRLEVELWLLDQLEEERGLPLREGPG